MVFIKFKKLIQFYNENIGIIMLCGFDSVYKRIRKLWSLIKTIFFVPYIISLDSILVYFKLQELIKFDKENISIKMFYDCKNQVSRCISYIFYF